MEWHIRRKGEFYYKKAKELGYRSRSAFKLLEIQEKFRIIKNGNKVLDLGAAPGGWSQIASGLVGDAGRIVGVDIQPVPATGKNFKFVLADITKESAIKKISVVCNIFDVVLSDTAPTVSGFKDMDVGISEVLAFRSLELAQALLKEKGNFICKIFQGKRFTEFVGQVEKVFLKVVVFKPSASDKASKEVYVVALSKST